jgi:uncharacterized protein with gpF-like domain
VERILSETLPDDVIEQAFRDVRLEMRNGLSRSVQYFARDIPGPGTVAFDILNPRVLDAVRTLETRVMTNLSSNVRETVRQAIERGLVEGTAPKTVARELRSVIGLAPNQEEAVNNFRRSLEGSNGSPLRYKLRDKRFDRSIAKGGLSPEQIQKQTAAYRKRMLAFNAETHSRTAALDAQKLGQRLSWEDAIERGIVDASAIVQTWTGVDDGRERPEHVAMNGETVPFGEPFSNGDMVPGEHDYNCRCIALVSVRR